MASFGNTFSAVSGDFGNPSGWQPATIWVLLLLAAFGWLYALLIYVYLPSWKIRRIVAQEVIVGVFVTVVGFGFAIGWEELIQGWQAVGILMLCFAASGIPMAVGYWILDAKLDAKDREQAKEFRRKLIGTGKRDGE